jgi:hypothetical protein
MGAKEIANKLLADLKEGRLQKIGIEEIEEAVAAEFPTRSANDWVVVRMVGEVTRKVVEGAAYG